MLKPEILFFMLLATVTLAMILFSLLFWRLSRMTRELRNVRSKVGSQISDQKKERHPEFDHDLVLAEMKTRLQQPPAPHGAPDKYRYIGSLVEQGLDPRQIAQILKMGLGEAEQLVSLVQIRRPHSDFDGCSV